MRSDSRSSFEALLTFGEFGHHEVAVASLVLRHPVLAIHQCYRRKVMSACEVASQFAVWRFPSAKRFCGGGETGRQPESMEQWVGARVFKYFRLAAAAALSGPSRSLTFCIGKGRACNATTSRPTSAGYAKVTTRYAFWMRILERQEEQRPPLPWRPW